MKFNLTRREIKFSLAWRKIKFNRLAQNKILDKISTKQVVSLNLKSKIAR
ncbi:hypothetical protein [Campylobacter sp.]|nr:hypothetical protein [Campylobacter sp.]